MRKSEFYINGQVCTARYGDEVCFAFNPLFIEIESPITLTGMFKVSVSATLSGQIETREITVTSFGKSCRILYSRLLQVFYTEPLWRRSIDFTVNLIYGAASVATFRHVVLWGSISLEDRFESYRKYKVDNAKFYRERRRIWFRNFPFLVSMFCSQANDRSYTVVGGKDGGALSEVTYTKMAPKFDGSFRTLSALFSSLSSYTYHDTLLSGTIDKVYFVESQFYCVTTTNDVSPKWTMDSNGYRRSSAYNGTDSALSDKKFVYDERFWQYDKVSGNIVALPFGMASDFGVFEMVPTETFSNVSTYAVYEQRSTFNLCNPDVFDPTFDYTFHLGISVSDFAVRTKLIVDDSSCGFYLRWIDQMGFMQYYLFVKGDENVNNKANGSTIPDLDSHHGMYFQGLERTASIEAAVTNKCCAVSMPDDIWEYVSTILSSPLVDLYIGKTKFGEEIWKPVNISDSNHTYNPKKVLHDLEITFKSPSIQSQTL